ncbi:MAG: hypothetical protein ABUK01_09820 [Leptospirales bacterium]
MFIEFPAEIELKWFGPENLYQPLIHGMNGFLYGKYTVTGEKYLLGRVGYPHRIELGSPSDDYQFNITAEINVADLIEWEKLRKGQEPVFEFHLDDFYVSAHQFGEHREYIKKLRTYRRGANLTVKLNRDRWVDALNQTRLYNYQVVELPNSLSDSEENIKITKSINEAITNFEQGGPMGWRGCVASIRDAVNHLEKFNNLQIDNNKKDKSLNRNERWVRFYKGLKNLAHQAHHTENDDAEWSRDEAQLILTSFIGLMKLKNALLQQNPEQEKASV